MLIEIRDPISSQSWFSLFNLMNCNWVWTLSYHNYLLKCQILIVCPLTLHSGFVEEKMGAKYVENRQVEFAKSYEESGPGTPIFFILSPGVDPLKDVEALGKKLGFTFDNKNFHNVSLGQVRKVCP